MKALGTKKGFPDLILPVASTAYPGLVIEMKYGPGKPTPEQVAWLDHFAAQGWSVLVCYSAEEARGSLCDYLGIDLAIAPPLE